MHEHTWRIREESRLPSIVKKCRERQVFLHDCLINAHTDKKSERNKLKIRFFVIIIVVKLKLKSLMFSSWHYSPPLSIWQHDFSSCVWEEGMISLKFTDQNEETQRQNWEADRKSRCHRLLSQSVDAFFISFFSSWEGESRFLILNLFSTLEKGNQTLDENEGGRRSARLTRDTRQVGDEKVFLACVPCCCSC